MGVPYDYENIRDRLEKVKKTLLLTVSLYKARVIPPISVSAEGYDRVMDITGYRSENG